MTFDQLSVFLQAAYRKKKIQLQSGDVIVVNCQLCISTSIPQIVRPPASCTLLLTHQASLAEKKLVHTPPTNGKPASGVEVRG